MCLFVKMNVYLLYLLFVIYVYLILSLILSILDDQILTAIQDSSHKLS